MAAAAAVTDEPTWNFLAIGDWGNDSPGQHAAAAGMGEVAAQINATQVYVAIFLSSHGAKHVDIQSHLRPHISLTHTYTEHPRHPATLTRHPTRYR